VRSEGTPGAVAPSSIEVLVDEYGNVERVRLQPARWSVHERMLVSAVKAWRFHPALKDGKPVKYAMRIAVPREHGQ
jgi:outer membrane biosynthesis protein TonB